MVIVFGNWFVILVKICIFGWIYCVIRFLIGCLKLVVVVCGVKIVIVVVISNCFIIEILRIGLVKSGFLVLL